MERAQLEAWMQATPVTHLALAWLEAGQVAGIHTLGDWGLERVWAVASLSKPVLAYAVLRLVEQGLLELDRPLQTYLPQAYANDAHSATMSARHALSHTTGFPNWRAETGLRAAFAPGTRFSYSSEGLSYVQHVVEQRLGLPLPAILEQQVFRPLGMAHTHLASETPAELPPHLRFLSGGLLANGALSLRTTIGDYARFMAAMLTASDPAAQAMLHPQVAIADVPGLHWGLGWGLQTSGLQHSFWHWGARGIPMAMTLAMGIPAEQRAMVIFTDHSDGLALCQRILSAWAGVDRLPAFDWLLPAQDWRPDGKRHA